jgi:hypothetical protein
MDELIGGIIEYLFEFVSEYFFGELIPRCLRWFRAFQLSCRP